MDSTSGTYVLVFHNLTEFTAKVGKLGSITIFAGYCAYIGSAFGPGGLKSRVYRHRKKKRIQKWHIDYVRNHMDLVEVWYSDHPEKLECLWAGKFHSLEGACPINKFGASDCKCESHFFYFESAPNFSYFEDMNSESISREALC
tara:strand:- start:254 stop:685 length:432 start_codon:yes stop_codon:yes gene_type:complete